MQLSSVLALLGAAATVSAVDLRGWANSESCQGGAYKGCANALPDKCCNVGNAKSVGAFAVPDNWKHLTIHRFQGANCDFELFNTEVRMEGAVAKCLKKGDQNYPWATAKSIRYNFGKINPKRGESVPADMPAESRRSVAGAQIECREADHVGFSDGTQYNITGMAERDVERLMNFARSEDVPEEFDALKL